MEPKQTAFVCRRECLAKLEGQILTLMDATSRDNKHTENVKSLFRVMYHDWIRKWDNYGVEGEPPTPSKNMGMGGAEF